MISLQYNKKTAYYNSYISKVLKQISENSSININTKHKINYILCIISNLICKKILEILICSEKKTVKIKHVKHALRLVLSNEIAEKCIEHSDTVFSNKDKYKKKDILIFPCFIAKKFLNNFNYYNISIAKNTCIFFASSIEYFCADILEVSKQYTHDNNHKRITDKYLKLSIKEDIELYPLFTRLNIIFLYRINNKMHFSKKKMQSLIRHSVLNYNNNIKISKDFFIHLQSFIEEYLINILFQTNMNVRNASRVKIKGTDILLTLKLLGKDLYFLNT